MIFLQLIFVFSKIGIFNFGSGYAMLSLIQNEVVTKNQWLSNAEFTDLVAISQSTPGPIGINVATYSGYTAVINAGYSQSAAILGAILASLSVIWLPLVLMIAINRYLIKNKNSKEINDIFKVLRPTVIGLIAAAALSLMTEENFGSYTENPYLFGLSILLFGGAFYFSLLKKTNPILILFIYGIMGLLFY